MFLNLLKKEANTTYTENGAVTYRSTLSDCLDLFATIGALRNADESDIVSRFVKAYAEDADTAMKTLFFARDIRGGLGERRVFKTILAYLAVNEPESVRRNISYIAEYGRFDDLLALIGTPCESDMMAYIMEQLDKDVHALEAGGSVSLLAKWLPSVNASNADTVKNAKKIARAMGMSDAQYRKTLTAFRARIKIIENNLREKDYSFDYEKQPSKALYKYRAAFLKNDTDRYNTFISRVNSGEVKLHADNIYPYELVEPYLDTGWTWSGNCFMKDITPEEKRTLNATWESMPDFGGNENAIAVIDTSGSMYCNAKPIPAAVALSLGLYYAEHNKGFFRNHFIEFSANPKLIEIKGDTFADRLRYVCTFNEIANTNLEAVFEVILKTAVKNKVSQDELPAKLIIISDMEFDACVLNASADNFKNAADRYAEFGYTLPQIVFWNVASRNRQQPVTRNEQGVALVSGCSPHIFSMLSKDDLDPYSFMMDVLHSERYEKIVA